MASELKEGVGSQAAVDSHSPLKVVRADPLPILFNTRFCVVTTVEASVIPVVEASGENLSGRIRAFNSDLYVELARELMIREAAGVLTPFEGGSRVETRGDHRTDGADCVDKPDTIVVRQHISHSGNKRGYRLTLSASRAGAEYRAFVERSSVKSVNDFLRSNLAEDVEYLPLTGEPFWDVYRDSVRISRSLLVHLFGKDVG
jgi:hypothetical protein